MTLTELASLIGQTVDIQLEELAVSVKVLDAKQAYGKTRVLVEPIKGKGQAWVDIGRLVNQAAIERHKK